jgi:hypothetical protein
LPRERLEEIFTAFVTTKGSRTGRQVSVHRAGDGRGTRVTLWSAAALAFSSSSTWR